MGFQFTDWNIFVIRFKFEKTTSLHLMPCVMLPNALAEPYVERRIMAS